jgi:adenine-specific DNA-methyltransferase
MKNNGVGSFVYCELMQLNEAFADRILTATSSDELLALWEEIKGTGFVSYRVRPEEFDAKSFGGLSLGDQKRLLMATLEKNLLYVNLCDLEDADYGVSEDDKSFNHSFYGRGDTP